MAEADPYLPAGEVDGPGPVAKADPYLPAGEVGAAVKLEPKQRGKKQKESGRPFRCCSHPCSAHSFSDGFVCTIVLFL